MGLLKRLFGKKKPAIDEHKGEQLQGERKQWEHKEEQIQNAAVQKGEQRKTAEKEQVQKEEQQLVRELAASREILLAIEQTKAEYVLDEDIPVQLNVGEDRTRKRVAELENKCTALGIELAEDALVMREHSTRLLAKARENLSLIESRKEMYKSEADIPIQLTKAEQRWRTRIAELKSAVGEE